MDSVAATGVAAIAACLSAVSAYASWRSSRAIATDAKLNQATARYELFRSYETTYADLHDALWSQLGPWNDPVDVDLGLRRVVHDTLQALVSIYNAAELELVDKRHATYLSDLFLDWLRLPKAKKVWEDIFRVQTDAWPDGFVAWLDSQLVDELRRDRRVA